MHFIDAERYLLTWSEKLLLAYATFSFMTRIHSEQNTLPKIRTLKPQRPLCEASPFLSPTNLKGSLWAGNITMGRNSLLCPFFRSKIDARYEAAALTSREVIWTFEKKRETISLVWNVCLWSSNPWRNFLRFWPGLLLLKTVNIFSEN